MRVEQCLRLTGLARSMCRLEGVGSVEGAGFEPVAGLHRRHGSVWCVHVPFFGLGSDGAPWRRKCQAGLREH
eukprot:1835860-Alexandrium_andersonii.AAC.1